MAYIPREIGLQIISYIPHVTRDIPIKEIIKSCWCGLCWRKKELICEAKTFWDWDIIRSLRATCRAFYISPQEVEERCPNITFGKPFYSMILFNSGKFEVLHYIFPQRADHPVYSRVNIFSDELKWMIRQSLANFYPRGFSPLQWGMNQLTYGYSPIMEPYEAPMTLRWAESFGLNLINRVQFREIPLSMNLQFTLRISSMRGNLPVIKSPPVKRIPVNEHKVKKPKIKYPKQKNIKQTKHKRSFR
jgi:hypothetical protein